MAAIETAGLRKSFDSTVAVDELSFPMTGEEHSEPTAVRGIRHHGRTWSDFFDDRTN